MAECEFNFDEIVNRRGFDDVKYQTSDEVLPMWVADMDFRTVPEVVTALQQRAERGVFGYSVILDSWNEAVRSWWERRHHCQWEKEWVVFSCGVIPAVSSIVRKLTTPGEKVLLQTPVYNCFFNCILNNGRVVIENELSYEAGSYSINFEDLEAKLADPQTSLMILCNPHNPIGKIWDRATLARIGSLCHKHGVVVLSDEIHCDLTDPGCEYVPFTSVNEECASNSITCVAPSKTFNLAGLKSAAVIVPNPFLRHKVWRALNTDEVAEPNAFALAGATAAYLHGDKWLDALRDYLFENKRLVQEYLAAEIPQVKLVSSDATYLLWLDCGDVRLHSPELANFLKSKAGLWLSSGIAYGECGAKFLRMNIACPRSLVAEGLRRLKKGVADYEEWSLSQLPDDMFDD